MLGGTIGTIMQNSVYAATVDKVPGAVFWLTSGIFFLSAILVFVSFFTDLVVYIRLTALFTKPPSSVLPTVGTISETVPVAGPIHGLRDFQELA